MKRVRHLLRVGLCLVVGLSLANAGEIEQIQAKGEVVVSLNKEYPPFAMVIDGQPVGLDVDLARLLADYLKVKVRFVQPDRYDQQIPLLLSGETDIIMAAMTRTVARGVQVNFSAPYFEVSQAALVRRRLARPTANSYFDLLDIEGLRLGVKAGTTHEIFARDLFPADAIHLYPTAAAAAEAIVKGEVDAMVADSPFVKIWRNTHVQHYSQIAAWLEPVTREFYAFAIRRGDPDFLSWLNLFVDQIKTDGTLDLLNYEYFEQMAWASEKVRPKKKLTRAKFLQNRFVANKKALIEQRRQEAARRLGDNYE
jgi:polar amino acid transport system substrate-binding protein